MGVRAARTGWLGFWIAAVVIAATATAVACTDQAVIGTPGAGPYGGPALKPPSGPPGTVVLIEGRKFYDRAVEVRWRSLEGPLLTTAHGPEFATQVTVPDRPAGAYMVVALVRNEAGQVDAVARAPFRLTASGAAPAGEEPGAASGAGGADPDGSGSTSAGEAALTDAAAPRAGEAASDQRGVSGGHPEGSDAGAGQSGAAEPADGQFATRQPAGPSNDGMLVPGLVAGGLVLLLGVAAVLVVRRRPDPAAGWRR